MAQKHYFLSNLNVSFLSKQRRAAFHIDVHAGNMAGKIRSEEKAGVDDIYRLTWPSFKAGLPLSIPIWRFSLCRVGKRRLLGLFYPKNLRG